MSKHINAHKIIMAILIIQCNVEFLISIVRAWHELTDQTDLFGSKLNIVVKKAQKWLFTAKCYLNDCVEIIVI